ncbi:MAG: hypothetical protein RBT03_07220, partial [Kiritimatiellia bacterium]|nr:hypothetical protein [Kiritimatiellia bacterium]
TGGRSQNGGRKPGRWTLLLAVVVLAGCAAPKVQFTDSDWVAHVTTGRGCYERGDVRRGADAFGRAQERARALDDAEALAVAAVNRAVCLQQMDQAAEALAGVEEALADARVSAARQLELQVAGARAELALEQPGQARLRAARVLDANPPPILRAQALLVQGRADLAQMEAAAAEQTLARLAPAAWRALPASLRAERAELEGRIAAVLESPDRAWTWHEEAVLLWQDAGRLPNMARALAEAGRQAWAAGASEAASDRFWRAARSLWAQGLRDEAVHVLEEGVACAAAFKDEVAGQRLADLWVTFQGETRPMD